MEAPIDYEFWKFWLTVINSAATAILGTWLFITQRSRVNSSRIEALEDDTKQRIDKLEFNLTDKIVDQEKRLERIEERNKHMPTHEDFARVHKRLDAQSEKIESLSGEFRGANHTLNLIHQYLLDGKK